MSLRNWPAAERPREKLLQRGSQALSDAELLAIVLRTGVPGRNAVDLARDLLGRFGRLPAPLAAARQPSCAAQGLGPAKSAQDQATPEAARREMPEVLDRGASTYCPDPVWATLR